jgi:hypothetical protein
MPVRISSPPGYRVGWFPPFIEQRVTTGHYELCDVAVTHRLGRVEIGETSVTIAVSAPHRHDALVACKDVIDAFKERVSLWEEGALRGRRGVDRARLVRRGQALRESQRKA